ncbi:MAG TPA: DHH family phosphoesterase [Candidatus Merdibacter merdavium]|uniref:Cyclic-di-AMP phosphodiesterase n=1 Tax=Candidatus Merdibacter merdavium TaxID=2838692 RepID=A0A9D2NPS5_9FIRM|nr:DHH family phosphoesterase [Candidatus Merdibacter merdavium]
MERLENFKVQLIIVIAAQVLAIVLLFMFNLQQIALIVGGVVLVNVLIEFWIMNRMEKEKKNTDLDITRALGRDAKDALVFGGVGIITYDEQYCATWVSELLEERGVDLVGKKLSSWISSITELFNADGREVVIGQSKGRVYEVTHKEDTQLLYVRDITELFHLRQEKHNNGIVVGLLQLDNYNEYQQYEDDTVMSQINTRLRQPLFEWAREMGMFTRRLRSDRILVLLDEEIYEKLEKAKFPILNTVRATAEEMDVSITLSMAFARGTSNYVVLDGMINELIELAQSRGGDQVAVRAYGHSVHYFGGNSESKSDRSKVRVRVMSQTIREAIIDSGQVFIVGHQMMDFDCMGAALCMSRIAQRCERRTFIVSEGCTKDAQLEDALRLYRDDLSLRHAFLSEDAALAQLQENDLIIMVDHHAPAQSCAQRLVDQAKRIIVIDHHRRSAGFVNGPLVTYLESGASSACELTTEMLSYQPSRIDISDEEATIMYLGIVVDTNRFKMRTGSRTFEAAAVLKKLGADPVGAENILSERVEQFEEKTAIAKYAQLYRGKYMIAAVTEAMYPSRPLMAQVADQLLTIRGVEASFVIAQTAKENDVVAVSSRSRGNVNVQTIMEKMRGGGHFTAAALQREHAQVMDIEAELKQVLDAEEEDKEDESNTVE